MRGAADCGRLCIRGAADCGRIRRVLLGAAAIAPPMLFLKEPVLERLDAAVLGRDVL